MPSTQDEIAAMEAHLAGLHRKVEEEEERAEAAVIVADQARLATAKAEAEKKVAAAEATEKAASAKKAAGCKGKHPVLEVEEINDNDNDEVEKVPATGSLVLPTKKCNWCACNSEDCQFSVGSRMSGCTICQWAAKACAGASGLLAKLQQQIELKSDQSPQRKKPKRRRGGVRGGEPLGRTKGKGKAAEKGKGKAAEKEKGKGKGKVAEKPLAPVVPPAPIVSSTPCRSSSGVPVGILPSGASSQAAGPVPALDKFNPRWSVDPEQLTDHKLLQHLLVEMQRNRWTSGWVVDLMVHEEAHRAELSQKEQKALKAAMAEVVRMEMKLELGISVRQLVWEELQEQLEEFQEVMMLGSRLPCDSEVENDQGPGRAESEEEEEDREEERGRSGSRGRAELCHSGMAEEAEVGQMSVETGGELQANMDMDTA
ncbi:hypothetical protein GY45DRAFT_1340204 [Cubamyces sp. BRFM 1775]|nr:hypothetical protein GY45DRAFT_1340204 [Cubamyces sp. BRFM 1775]